MNGTWVKNYREIQNWKYYKKPDYAHLWQHIIRQAHHGSEPIYDGFGNKIVAGQFSTGRVRLSEETGLNQSKIERILKTLEKERQIEQLKTPKCRIITITKWSEFQQTNTSRSQVEQQVNNKRTTSEQQVNTEQECKNGKNGKNNNIYVDSDEQNQPQSDGLMSLNDKMETIKDYWNIVAEQTGLPQVSILNSKRKTLLKKALSEVKSHDEWKTIISQVPCNNFRIGENDRNWKANFDWLIRSDKQNYLKMLEESNA